MDSAVIFDVDGVLLELEAEEEDVFFRVFESWCDPATLSRDWNSYRIRNDDDIVDEIMMRENIPREHKSTIVARYIADLRTHLVSGGKGATAVDGAPDLLRHLSTRHRLGIATANFLEAAHLRLHSAKLWPYLSAHAQGADGGGHKHHILARLLQRMELPRNRIVYVGDNANDVEASLKNQVYFIGFSTSAARRATLESLGAKHISASHDQTLALIRRMLTA